MTARREIAENAFLVSVYRISKQERVCLSCLTLNVLQLSPGVVVEPLVYNLAVVPLGDDNLLHVNRLATGGNEVYVAFVERHIVADT